MFNCEVLSKKIANKLSSELNLDSDKKEVVAYGLFALIQIAISVIVVIIVGAIFNVVVEALIVSFTISILRKNSGGVHASSPNMCMFIGTIVAIVIALVAKNSSVDLISTIFLGIVVFIWCLYIVYKLAPVDSLAKPIRKKEKRERLKRLSVINIIVYITIVVVNLSLFYFLERRIFIVFSLCIYGGAIWQCFTLTKIGHIILGKIDNILSKA